MDAKPTLMVVARALREQRLEAVMIGNAAAALHGAPVTTLDVDFFIRKTAANVEKLKGLARALNAVVFNPFYPVSGLFRLIREADGLQLDFMTRIAGVSYKSVRNRASNVAIGGEKVLVANLAGIIQSKRAASRPKDLAVLHDLETTLKEQEADARGDSGSRWQESELDLRLQIRALLAKPPGERTHFLRRKIGLTGACL